ncbi:MAG: hypothetical protein P1V81_08260 [Planctomycetota bacterium]|nr:hypothetical protein [Planctomycetota bacterium]
MRAKFTAGLLALLASSASGQVPTLSRLDVSPSGQAPNAGAERASISPDGEHVVFLSKATNLVTPTQVTLDGRNLFLRDLRTGVVQQVNLDSTGAAMRLVLPIFDDSGPYFAVSGGGRHVLFSTYDDDALLGDINGGRDIYLRDVQAGTTELISQGSTGPVVSGDARNVSISDDGRFVCFVGEGDQYVPLPGPLTSSASHAYIRDRVKGSTKLISRAVPGFLKTDIVKEAVLSGDGNRVAMLLTRSSGTGFQLVVHDRTLATSTDFGIVSEHVVFDEQPSIAIDRTGSKVVFSSRLNGLVAGDNDDLIDSFLLDVAAGTFEHINLTTGGGSTSVEARWPSISPDGRYVSFESSGDELVPSQTPPRYHVFVRDLETGLTTLGSINLQAQPGSSTFTAQALTRSRRALSHRGRYLVYESNFENLVQPTSGTSFGIYLLDRQTDGPQLTVTNLVSTGTATMTVTGCVPNGAVLVGISLTGQGPISTPWGLVDLAPPLHTYSVLVNPAGVATLQLPLTPALAGLPLFARGLDTLDLSLTTPYFGLIQ